ncbi:MAG TPA: DASS family sodium-coupled anion symporter [Pseudomonadales bacterium]|nr:DASS family sodium-coupled anion symporter [Pseudomonadales bacterium]
MTPGDGSGDAEQRGRAPRPHAELPDGLLGWLELSSPRRLVLTLAIAASALFATWLVPDDAGLGVDGRRSLFVLLLAAGLWLTEAMPAFAVGLLVIGLQVLLLGDPAGAEPDWERHVLVLGHPLIWLFFGGLVLAAGMRGTGIDRWLATRVLTRFARSPRHLVTAVAGMSFLLSMLMSNTATTAMMLALVAPLIASRPVDDRLASTLVLAVPVGANLGGMGSLVGSPPNAIAAGMVGEQLGIHLSFARWFLIGLPPALVLAAVLIGLLLWRLGPQEPGAAPSPAALVAGADPRASHWSILTVAATLAVTLGLWLTQDLHGLPTPVVAVVPVVLLTATGILGTEAFRGLSWDVLLLMAGGLALGQAVHETGLAAWLVGGLPLDGLSPILFAMLAGAATLVLSNTMSNTAAANVLVPLVLSAVAAPAPALTVALCASAAMALPVATPPNALAHASGRLHARDFLLVGLVSAVLAPPLMALWTAFVVA